MCAGGSIRKAVAGVEDGSDASGTPQQQLGKQAYTSVTLVQQTVVSETAVSQVVYEVLVKCDSFPCRVVTGGISLCLRPVLLLQQNRPKREIGTSDMHLLVGVGTIPHVLRLKQDIPHPRSSHNLV
ncbi:hypothetical protein E2C01_000436 [Portunus trituberculatus]|uniref:Uncharacterized protein n=1 Tax=Portunus trituberculatus TaxID=210409 RepID=A0A5B7CF45_PORTR|nr:hypothetical protein [Portunus trituberculatus]